MLYRGHYITNPNNAIKLKMPENYLKFVLFDSPQMANIMTPLVLVYDFQAALNEFLFWPSLESMMGRSLLKKLLCKKHS